MSGLNRSWLYLGIQGHAVALDGATGAEMWRTKLTTGALVNVVADDRYLYAAAQGRVFCLDPATGTVLWKNPLKGLGLGLVSLVAPGGPGGSIIPLAAEQRRKAAQHS